MNTSLTESFGIAILEAACAGLYVVSTRVGGVPEILPADMISFADPDEDGKLAFCNVLVQPRCSQHPSTPTDVVRAMSEAIQIVSQGKHDPIRAHERVRTFYDWDHIAERTEKVYEAVLHSPQLELWARMQRFVFPLFNEALVFLNVCLCRTMALGTFAGPIYTIILIVDCLFFAFLEWWMPREDIDYVHMEWNQKRFLEVMCRLKWAYGRLLTPRLQLTDMQRRQSSSHDTR